MEKQAKLVIDFQKKGVTLAENIQQHYRTWHVQSDLNKPVPLTYQALFNDVACAMIQHF